MSGRRWVLVTGGSRGIGRGITLALANEGYDVFFTYRSSHDEAAALAASQGAGKSEIKGIVCDGTDAEAIAHTVAGLIEARGAPYALINNMGITRDTALHHMTNSQWIDVRQSNLDPVFYFTRAVVPAMIEKGDGVILQMSSVTGLKGNRGQTNYAATKAGMIGFTQSLAVELGRFNLRANAIAPGFIATDMVETMSDSQRRELTRQIPLKRLGSVDDVSRLVVFLLSENASYITGQTIVVDGGMTA